MAVKSDSHDGQRLVEILVDMTRSALAWEAVNGVPSDYPEIPDEKPCTRLPTDKHCPQKSSLPLKDRKWRT